MEVSSGTCVSAALDNDAAILEGSETTTPDDSRIDPAPPPTPDPCEYTIEGRCFREMPGKVIALESITLADVAQFRPDPGVDSMEPRGWGVLGLPTNFIATSTTHVREGTLLGQPASVKFTPVAWRWSYGDGSSRESTSPGALWSASGPREFDETPTSHTYRARGVYSVDLTVDFAAEYRLGAGEWRPIAGVLSLDTAPLTVTVGSAKTVLVGRDCVENPRGPGC